MELGSRSTRLLRNPLAFQACGSNTLHKYAVSTDFVTHRESISVQDLTQEILDYLHAMRVLLQLEYYTFPAQQDLTNVLESDPDRFQEVKWPHEPQQWLLTADFLHSLYSLAD